LAEIDIESRLDAENLDWLHFAMKKLQTKTTKVFAIFSYFLLNHFWKYQKA